MDCSLRTGSQRQVGGSESATALSGSASLGRAVEDSDPATQPRHFLPPDNHSFGRRQHFSLQAATDRLWGMPRVFLDVDPRELRVTSSRRSGANPMKLHRQIARFGNSNAGMPPIWVYEGSDGVLIIFNGVTRHSNC